MYFADETDGKLRFGYQLHRPPNVPFLIVWKVERIYSIPRIGSFVVRVEGRLSIPSHAPSFDSLFRLPDRQASVFTISNSHLTTIKSPSIVSPNELDVAFHLTGMGDHGILRLVFWLRRNGPTFYFSRSH